MDQREKQEYMEKYEQEKKKGSPFFPDIIFKDAVVSFAIFLALVGLAYFVGAPLEQRADPADTSYTPRPEWYFLFLFQLLKYFPGRLEVLGVVVIPTIAVLLLIGLPFLDRSNKRHFLKRPVVMGVTLFAILGIGVLTIQAFLEAPPPAEAAEGDPTASLYTRNCAGCHGSNISVPEGTNLHNIIAQGKHEGMPAWSGDLTTDQIDALAGFILSPTGSALFNQNCGSCHAAPDLVAEDPLQLRDALDQGPNFGPHTNLDVPVWTEVLDKAQQNSLLNFLVAPDGKRLFTINCSSCHGNSVGFAGTEDELRTIIRQGGLHLEMPPWQQSLAEDDLNTLARYVAQPEALPEGEPLFERYCSECHGDRIPTAETEQDARETIVEGGPHVTMPVWGNILTDEQLNALVLYTMEAVRGTPFEVGQDLYVEYCANCHGEFGEGGLNPARPDDIIAPISSSEYLKTRDDITLRSIITQGQPNFGMSPFGSSAGGPLESDEIDAIVSYIRSWESNPPVELPPEVQFDTVALDGAAIYMDICAQCHGDQGQGNVGPALSSQEFQQSYTDQEIFETINLGHDATAMIAWGEVLSSKQIEELVKFIRQMEPVEGEQAAGTETPEPETGEVEVSFSQDVMPIFETKCTMCHGTLGGWDASDYEAVMTTGDNAPVVIPGDVEGSLLAQKILGTHEEGAIMPPGGMMADEEIQPILDWIEVGAPDN